MIQELPPGVVQRIVNYLLELPPTKYDSDKPGYVGLRSLNSIHQPKHLLNLAHTCKSLRALVYPTIFRLCACHKRKNEQVFVPQHCREEDSDCKEHLVVDIFDMESRHFTAEPIGSGCDYCLLAPFVSAARTADNPQFYLSIGFQYLGAEALRHVQHLSLLFRESNEIYFPWLGNILPKMSSLNEVTINLYSPRQECNRPATDCLNFLDLMYVVKALLAHKNKIRIHMFVKLFFSIPSSTFRYFEKLNYVLTLMDKLEIETLMIQPGNEEYTFPISFCQVLKNLKHLKKFVVKPIDKYKYYKEDVKVPEPPSCSTFELVDWLSGISDLQYVDLEPWDQSYLDGEFNEWKPSSSLSSLGMNQKQLSL